MRVENWPELLAEYIQRATDVPFEWGVHDCATFAAGWIEAVTGEQVPLPDCNSAADYARLMQAEGGMRAIVETILGDPMLDKQGAIRGDIALVPMGERLCLGVVAGAYVAGPSEAGLVVVPRNAIVAAWTV